MGWFSRRIDPGAPQPRVPDLEDGPFIFKVSRLDDGRLFHTWTCQICLTQIGTCRTDWGRVDRTSLRVAIFSHMKNCPPKPCGQEMCIHCITPAADPS